MVFGGSSGRVYNLGRSVRGHGSFGAERSFGLCLGLHVILCAEDALCPVLGHWRVLITRPCVRSEDKSRCWVRLDRELWA